MPAAKAKYTLGYNKYMLETYKEMSIIHTSFAPFFFPSGSA